MQIFYKIVALLSCIICALSPGHVVAQHVDIRINCTVLPRCNGTDTSAAVCATTGQSCKLFSSECELQRENCNRTLATAWNRTESIECANLRPNTTGLCACSSRSLEQLCSNQTVLPTGICAHGGLADRVHICHLFRTECDMRRARCSGEDWRTIDNRQCRGFVFNQSNPCICPKLLQCSRDGNPQCVRVSAKGCRLYANDCEVELQRCNGERLVDIAMEQCRNITVGQSGNCHCPGLIHCRRNNTNICVRNAVGRCQLIGNECDMEQMKCRGSALTVMHSVNCQNFPVNAIRTCTCPNLLNCNRNASSICVRQANNQCQRLRNDCELEQAICERRNLTVVAANNCSALGPSEIGACSCPGLQNCLLNRTNICVATQTGCELKRNQCELELARCQGQVFTTTSSLQCLGFLPGERNSCTCPRLNTCSRNASNVCVRTPQGCMLLQNECQLEEEKCKGTNVTIVDAIQCRGQLAFNRPTNCSCPNLGVCSATAPSVCATVSSGQCRLLTNQCELEKSRCEGRVLTVVSPLQCRNYTVNTTSSCTCPNLLNCDQNSNSLCVRQRNSQCLLMRNSCEVEQAICEGVILTPVHIIQCNALRMNVSGNCSCPSLLNCSRNRTNICIETTDGCKLKRNECELELSRCQGQELRDTSPLQCLRFLPDERKPCTCPRLRTCTPNNATVCARSLQGCILFENECKLEEERCKGTSLAVLNPLHCQNFTVNTTRNCLCPSLLNCNRNSSSVCVRHQPNRCQLLRNNCDLEEARCEGRDITRVHAIQCSSLSPNETGTCSCPALENCSLNGTSICIRTQMGCELKRNQCELELSRCQGQVFQTTSPLQCLGFLPAERRICTCPRLSTCSRNTTNLCVTTPVGCMLLQNECELEEERCKGSNLTLVDSVQCRGQLLYNRPTNCSCPNLGSCIETSPNVCAVDSSNQCRLLRNQCEVEKSRCEGRALTVVSPLQCRNFSLSTTRNCSCPNLLTCDRNSRPICVRNGNSQCQLLPNNCDLERAKCEGHNLTLVHIIQCRSLRPHENGTCSCPSLFNCSLNRTNICVETTNGCILKRHECELELSRCLGKEVRITSPLQCLRFQPDTRKACTCPRLSTCSANNTNLCVRTAQGCMLLENECDLEEERCRGTNLTLVDGLQCRGQSIFNRPMNCSCPNLGVCNETSPNVCAAAGSNQCLLLRNQCELEKSRCEGRALTSVSSLQCRNLSVNTTGDCSCPNLLNCDRNSSPICVRQPNSQCQLLSNNCELEQAKCEGLTLTQVHIIQCRSLRTQETGTCACPSLFSCSLNRTNICVETTNGCKLKRNECELELTRCQGQELRITSPLQCLRFQPDIRRACTCPRLGTCSPNNTNICTQTTQGCMLLENECKVEEERCKGNNLTLVDGVQCRGQSTYNNPTNCSCPNLGSCSETSPNVCVVDNTNQCRLLENQCELERSRCEGRAMTVVNPLHCRAFTVNTTRDCVCPSLLTCERNSSQICVQNENSLCQLLGNNCELEQAKCEGRNLTLVHNIQCRSLRIQVNGTCSCPSLLNCSLNRTNLCVETTNGCMLKRNECELELSRCQGEELRSTSPLQCLRFALDERKPCTCPRLRTCASSNTTICARSLQGCILLENECKLEEERCKGTNLTAVSTLNCHNLPTGVTRSCTCPNLLNCSSETRRICIKANNTCSLLMSECEVEQEKCRGNVFEIISPMHCRNFEFGQTSRCSCPELLTCNRNRSDVCIATTSECKRLRNRCELEELKCQGQNITVLPNNQCQLLALGENGSCWCPNLLNCQRNSSQVCAESSKGCRLIKTACEFELMKCQGQNITATNILHCQHFPFGQDRPCTCPSLKSCLRNERKNICVRGKTGCKLMADTCALEASRCKGQHWVLQDAVQCQKFAVGYIGTCTCPRLLNCSQRNNRNVCFQKRSECKYLRNQCEVEKSRCLNEGFLLTIAHRCQGIRIGTTAACRCPEMRRCHGSRAACASNGEQCKLFRNDCELKRAQCHGERWTSTGLESCCELRSNESKNCSLSSTTAVCGRLSNQICRLFNSECELNAVNAKTRIKFSIVERSQCQCVGTRRTGLCTPAPQCTVVEKRPRTICTRFHRDVRRFNSLCDLRQHNHRSCRNFQVVPAAACAHLRS